MESQKLRPLVLDCLVTLGLITYYIQCTGKYHESVVRIGTSAAGTSTNTGNGRVMCPSTLCVMYLSYGQLCLAGQGDKNLDPKERCASNQ